MLKLPKPRQSATRCRSRRTWLAATLTRPTCTPRRRTRSCRTSACSKGSDRRRRKKKSRLTVMPMGAPYLQEKRARAAIVAPSLEILCRILPGLRLRITCRHPTRSAPAPLDLLPLQAVPVAFFSLRPLALACTPREAPLVLTLIAPSRCLTWPARELKGV